MNDQVVAEQVAAFETTAGSVKSLGRQLEAVPHWQPAVGHLAYVNHVTTLLEDLRSRFAAKPTIAFVGPTGSGKSTLVNALIMKDDAVAVGVTRPTTRDITVITRSVEDAGQLLDRVNHDRIHVVPSPTTPLREAIIVDTPDTDSGECQDHRPLLESILALTDVMICVFDAHNPKRRDNIVALAEWVNTFPVGQIYLVLNMSDRISETELTNSVVPDFRAHIERAWSRKVDKLFCVSARSSLCNPGWPDNERPLHNINQTDDLRNCLRDLGGGALFVDRRLDRARHLYSISSQLVADAVQRVVEDLRSVRTSQVELQREVADELISAVSRRMNDESSGITVLLYAAMAQRWWGPTGVFLSIWRRLVDAWSPLSLARSLSILNLPLLLVRSIRAVGNPERYEAELERMLSRGLTGGDFVGAKIKIAKRWPEIAERLVDAGFDTSVRGPSTFMDLKPLEGISRQIWERAVSQAVDHTATRLSRQSLQWILNAPVLCSFIAVCAQLVLSFIRQSYLPSAFFLHAGVILLLLWLLPSWLLQCFVHRAIARIPATAMGFARESSHEGLSVDDSTKVGIMAEVERVIGLGVFTRASETK